MKKIIKAFIFILFLSLAVYFAVNITITKATNNTAFKIEKLILDNYGIKPSELRFKFNDKKAITTEQALRYLNQASVFYMKKNLPDIKPENIKFNNWMTNKRKDKNKIITPNSLLPGIQIVLDTEKYIASTDIKKFEVKGSDFNNVIFDPERIGKSIEDIDEMKDYDFKRLKDVEILLKYVDRRRTLRHFFTQITKDSKNNDEIYLAVFNFLAKSSFHNPFLQAIYPDKQMVTDPLVLLELGEIRCGQTARIAVDLFSANNYKARLVQAGGHVFAEVFYDQKWHYFDADKFGGKSVVRIGGEIPSTVELSKQPFLIDSLASDIEGNVYADRIKDTKLPYPSFYYFSSKSYVGNNSVYYVKTATETEELNKLYGWNYYQTVIDNDRILYDMDALYKPLSVEIKNITVVPSISKEKKYRVEWYSAFDGDNDLVGYRIFVSNKSRGWAFETFYGSSEIEKFRSHPNGYDSSMYDKLFAKPYGNVAIIKTSDTHVDISVPTNKAYYITITPLDQHGENIGGTFYFRSDELKLSNP